VFCCISDPLADCCAKQFSTIDRPLVGTRHLRSWASGETMALREIDR
jgi:hypothetical protein